jgi:hypothetical protein
MTRSRVNGAVTGSSIDSMACRFLVGWHCQVFNRLEAGKWVLRVVGSVMLTIVLLFPLAAVAQEGSGDTVAPSRNAVISLAVSPADPAVVLAGTINTPDPSNIYRSSDGARSWAPSGAGLLTEVSIAAIVHDPSDPSLVLAADGGYGHLFRSVDGGERWEEVEGFQALLSTGSAVGSLFTAEENGQTVFYAGTRFDGLLRSADRGVTWARWGVGLTGDALRVRSIARLGTILYIGTHNGLHRLFLGGATWQPVAGFPGGTVVRGLALHAGRLYAGTVGSGLYVSDDGVDWTQVPGIPAAATVYDVTSAGYALVVATESGLWSDVSGQWTRAQVDGAEYGGSVYRLASAASAPGVIYAGTAENWVLRSVDGGNSYASQQTLVALVSGLIPAPPTATPTITPIPTETPTPTETPLPAATPTSLPTLEPAANSTPEDAATVVALLTSIAGVLVTPQTEEATPVATATPSPIPTFVPPTATSTAGATEALPATATVPAQEPATVAAPVTVALPTDTPVPLPTVTLAPDEPAATRVPAEALTRLPPVWVGGGLVLLMVVIIAGLAIARGPRDI